MSPIQHKDPVLINDISPYPFLKSGHIVYLVQKDAHCSETYEKNILAIIVF